MVEEAGVEVTGRELWDRGYHNKLCSWRSVDDLIALIEERTAED